MELTRKYRRRPLEALENPLLKNYLSLWQRQRGDKPFPSRNELSPRQLAPVMPHMTLARVVDGGRDLELRIIGNEIVQAYGENYMGRSLSSLRHLVGEEMGDAYHVVVSEGLPVLLEGWFEIANQRCLHREVLLTPLGESGEHVDHVLSVGALSPDPHARMNIPLQDAGPAQETGRAFYAAS